MEKEFIIAIDGPSSSGKGTIAKRIADELSFIYLDTGAMYRAITYYCLSNNIDMQDEQAVLSATDSIKLEFTPDGETLIDGQNVSEEIRSNEVSHYVSEIISQYPSVRDRMVSMQRQMAKGNKIVVDGRDIGTVVFPNANLKFFISASLKERATRRYEQNKAKGSDATFEAIEAMLAHRDRNDINRQIAPLVLTDESIIIDSTNLNVEQTLNLALSYIHL